ncbi:MAG: hypothetical protein IJZ96_11105 [Lachnospiraceae bacterium]|nr:hypothetical protein [Lachnospiraceae bacterium]
MKKLELRQWLEKAIADGDIDRIEAFEKRLQDGMSILDVIDKYSLGLIADLPMDKLLKIKEAYPGLIERLTFDMALVHRNVDLLELKKDVFFKEGWEEIYERLFFLDGAAVVEIEAMCSQTGYFPKLYQVMKVIKELTGVLPKIPYISVVLSVAETFYLTPGCENQDYAEAQVEHIWKIREITEEYGYENPYVTRNNIELLRKIKWNRYHEVYLNLNKLTDSYDKGNVEILCRIIKVCDTDKLVLESEELLKNSGFIEMLLVAIGNDKLMQKKIAEVYEKSVGIKVLYENICENEYMLQAFSTIISEYMAKYEADELIKYEEG